MQILLETERLTLRPFFQGAGTAGDVDALVALHNDPAVMRYLGRAGETRETVREVRIPRFLELYERGYGYWAAIERETGAFLGWFLFRPPIDDPAPGDVELGYRLHTAAWGRGFATEGALAIVDKGFLELGVQRVVAQTMAVNAGSRRVLEKVGLRCVGTFQAEYDEPVAGTEHGDVAYVLTRGEWAARRAGGRAPSATTPPR